MNCKMRNKDTVMFLFAIEEKVTKGLKERVSATMKSRTPDKYQFPSTETIANHSLYASFERV